MVVLLVIMVMVVSQVGVGSYGGDGGDDGTFCTMVLMLCCSFEEWYGSPMANLGSPPFSSLHRSLKMTMTQCLSLQSLQKNITAR